MPSNVDEAKYVVIAQTVWELRLAGHSMHAVAELMNEPIATCYRAWSYFVRKLVTPKAEEARNFELAFIDRLLLALEAGIMAGSIPAIREARGLSERRAKLLGLDMPAQVEHRVQVIDAVDDEIMRLTAEMNTRPAVVEP